MIGIPLPYKLAAISALIVGSYGMGRYQGSVAKQEAWDASIAKEQAGIAAEWIQSAKSAAISAQTIFNALGDARPRIAARRERTRANVNEVTHAVESNPDLAGVRQPDDVVRLHAEAVAESAAAADRARAAGQRRP